MNHHKKAGLTFARRGEMVRTMIESKLSPAAAATAAGVSETTARKRLARDRAGGPAALADAGSRPRTSPRAIPPAQARAIVELRRRRLTQARIATALGLSKSPVSRVLAREGLSKRRDLETTRPIPRDEHAAPGDLLHMDIKKLGRIERMSPRVSGDRRDRVPGAGWEFLFVAIDDHARVAFSRMPPDERTPSAVAFLVAALAYDAGLGITGRRLLTDNGGAFRSQAVRTACQRLGIRHKFTRAYRPQTHGKAERFIQSALREWAYGFADHHSEERTAMLDRWLHDDNDHRPHAGLGGLPPMSRLRPASDNNVLKLNN